MNIYNSEDDRDNWSAIYNDCPAIYKLSISHTPRHHAEEWYSILVSMVYSKSAVDFTYIIVFDEATGDFTD